MNEKGLADRGTASDGERIVVMESIKSAGLSKKCTIEAASKKEIKMYNQVKRIIDLSDRNFNTLVGTLKQKKGKKVENILHQLYRERKL